MAKFDAVIVGVGYTKYSANSGVSELALATEACQKAMQDAGMGIDDVDGVLEFNIGDSVPAEAVATALALPELNYAMDWHSGGSAPCALLATAAMAVDSGMAKAALVYRAMNGRSGFRLGGASGRITDVIPPSGGAQYRMPYGWLTFGEGMAMWCRRHMEKYGTKTEHLGAIAINQRKNAVLNERACQRKPLTMDDYMAGRLIFEPLRLFDMCLESDGGCALLLTSPDRAKDCRKKPIKIKAAAYVQHTGIGDPMYADSYLWDDFTKNYSSLLAPKLYEQSGLGPKDLDVAEIYDCFTYNVLMTMEGLGLCKRGEGGPFAASGETALSGSIPVNTHGGMLSEAYIHGVNVIVEAVEQLRGESGARQVAGAEVAAVTSGATTMGSGLILTV